MGQVCEIPRSGPFKPALPYRRYGTGHHGGKLAEIPKPHIRAFDVARRLRVVTVTITRFYGSGPHYYIRAKEEDNPIWNAYDDPPWHIGSGTWQMSWDDEKGRGKEENARVNTAARIRPTVDKILKQHFKGRRVEMQFQTGEQRKWFYREGG